MLSISGTCIPTAEPIAVRVIIRLHPELTVGLTHSVPSMPVSWVVLQLPFPILSSTYGLLNIFSVPKALTRINYNWPPFVIT